MLQIINRLQGQKFNPHHDKLGKFASGGTGGAGVIPEGGPLEADFVGEFTGPLFHGTTVEGAGEITKKGMKPSKLGITEEVFLGTSRNRVRFYENGGLVVYHVNKLNIVSNAHATDAAREIYDNKHDAFHAKLHKVGPSSPEAQRLYAFEERGGIQRQVRHELVRRGIDAYTQGSDTIVVLNLEKLGTPKVFTGDVLATKEFAQKSLTDIPDDKKFWQEIRQQVTKEIQPLFLELMLAGVEFATEAVNLMRKKASGQKAGPIDTAIYIPDEDILAREIAAWLPTFTNSWYDTIEITTRSRLREVLAQAVREGQSIDWVYKSIEPLFGATRALRISQTEMTRIFAKGQDMIYAEAGVDTVEWRTVRDFAVCSDCAPLHGKVFPRSSGPRPPNHVICRCFMAPHIAEEAAAEKFL
jgi:SPP1 gp7 family putative phage head morphogenesis protein